MGEKRIPLEVMHVFPCEKCGKTFDYLYALKRHGKNCGAKKPRKCKKCLKWFPNQNATSRHEAECFMDNTPLVCKFCGKSYEHLYTLQRHYRAAHRINMSKLNKKQVVRNFNFENDFQIYDETVADDGISACENEQERLNKEIISSSVYTIELENLSAPSDNDFNEQPNVPTLIYKIRETNSNTTEIELLQEYGTETEQTSENNNVEVVNEPISYEPTYSTEDNIEYEDEGPLTVYYGIE